VSVSLTKRKNERRLAVGLPYDKEWTDEKGVARVFGFDDYFQHCSRIELFVRDVQRFGWSVSLTGDGERIKMKVLCRNGLACVHTEDPTNTH